LSFYPSMSTIVLHLQYRKVTGMWHKEKVRVGGSAGAGSPWTRQLLVSFGPGRERIYPGEPRVWHPPTDVYETDADITVKIEIAGVEEDDFAVRLEGRVLTVYGYRCDPAAKLAYQQMEISYGEFRSQVYLPGEVDADGAKAAYEDGFLYVVLPKVHREQKVAVVVVGQRPSDE
jgi:HSP20 family protein